MRRDTVPGTEFIIYQNENDFSYSLDSLCLTSFARPRGICADLGAGTGIITLRIAANSLVKKIFAVEIQTAVCELLKESVKENKLDYKVEVLNENIVNLRDMYSTNTFDTILINPPYYDSYLKNLNVSKSTSRHALTSLEEFISVSKFLLKDKGRVYLVGPATRTAEIFTIFQNENLNVKRFTFVKKDIYSKARVVFVEAVKGSKKGSEPMRDIYIYEGGEYSKDYDTIRNNEEFI